jgi:GTP cyclohydrolase IA
LSYKRTEEYNTEAMQQMMSCYKDIIANVGEDPEREGLLKTPERVSKAMQFITQGYNMNAREILDSAKFHESYSEMVIVKDIELYSLCEHHMLPFFGKAHVAYIPNGWITGLW